MSIMFKLALYETSVFKYFQCFSSFEGKRILIYWTPYWTLKLHVLERIKLLLFNSWCSAHGFSPIPSNRIMPVTNIQKHGPLTQPVLLTDTPGFFQQKKRTEPESHFVNFCIRNYIPFILVKTSITFKKAEPQATWRQNF